MLAINEFKCLNLYIVKYPLGQFIVTTHATNKKYTFTVQTIYLQNNILNTVYHTQSTIV